jgi:hypothetical protein
MGRAHRVIIYQHFNYVGVLPDPRLCFGYILQI